MRIEKCWFCSSNIYPGHGIVFVRNDAKMFRFCRSKCHKHFKAKHNPRKTKWTKAYRKTSGKEMVVDSTFLFEKRRNCPIRYNRDLMVKTVQAMKKIDSIKEARKERFYKQRMLLAHSKQLEATKREITKHGALLHGPHIPENADCTMSEATPAQPETSQRSDVQEDIIDQMMERQTRKKRCPQKDVEMKAAEPIVHRRVPSFRSAAS